MLEPKAPKDPKNPKDPNGQGPADPQARPEKAPIAQNDELSEEDLEKISGAGHPASGYFGGPDGGK